MTDIDESPDALLLRNCPEQRIGLAIPSVLSDRIDALVGLAEAAGERTTRKELIAALILDASAQNDVLASIIRRYRLAPAEAAVVGNEPPQISPKPPARKPGPRPRHGPN